MPSYNSISHAPFLCMLSTLMILSVIPTSLDAVPLLLKKPPSKENTVPPSPLSKENQHNRVQKVRENDAYYAKKFREQEKADLAKLPKAERKAAKRALDERKEKQRQSLKEKQRQVKALRERSYNNTTSESPKKKPRALRF